VLDADAFRFHLVDERSISLSHARDHTMATLDRSFIIKSPTVNLKRKSSKIQWLSSDRSEATSRPTKSLKQTRPETNTISPLLLTSGATDSCCRDRTPSPDESPSPALVNFKDQGLNVDL
jgi:hypothetical protein